MSKRINRSPNLYKSLSLSIWGAIEPMCRAIATARESIPVSRQTAQPPRDQYFHFLRFMIVFFSLTPNSASTRTPYSQAL